MEGFWRVSDLPLDRFPAVSCSLWMLRSLNERHKPVLGRHTALSVRNFALLTRTLTCSKSSHARRSILTACLHFISRNKQETLICRYDSGQEKARFLLPSERYRRSIAHWRNSRAPHNMPVLPGLERKRRVIHPRDQPQRLALRSQVAWSSYSRGGWLRARGESTRIMVLQGQESTGIPTGVRHHPL